MKRIISLALASILAASAVSCAAPTAPASTSSDISASVAFLSDRVADTSDIIVGDADKAASLGIDMTDFEDSGYTIRKKDGQTAILGKTADGVDRAVRDFVKHQSDADYEVTVGEGYRVKRLTVAGNDIAEYVIVLPADVTARGQYHECVEYAATELRDYIKQACGAQLAIVTEAPADGKGIFLIPENTADSDLGDDGFETTVSGGKMTIRGGFVRGCLYGVYDFLEDIVGYRFLTAWDTYLYEADSVDIPDGYHNTEIPVLQYREVYDNSCSYTYRRGSFTSSPEFAARRKSNSSYTNQAKLGWMGLPNPTHGMSTYVLSVPDSQQPCLTDEVIFEECVENIGAYLKRMDEAGMIGKSVKQVNLGENDNPNFCYCKNCKAAWKKYGGTQSGLFVDFTSRVAEYFEDEYPTVRFGMFAYWGAIIPPKNIEAHKNIYLTYVMYGFDQKHPLDGSKCDPEITYQEGLNHFVHSEYIEGWRPIVHDQMYLWFYTVDFWRGLLPFMNVDDYCADFRWIAEKDFYGVFCQNGQSQLTFDELYVYLESLLEWDPYMTDEEFDAKMREFMELFYGDGWLALYNYLMEGCEVKNRLRCNETDPIEWQAEYYEDHKAAFAYASDNANSAIQADRIERLSLHMHYQALCGMYQDKYVNGTDAEKEELQTLWYWIRDELKKYKVGKLGLEAGKYFDDINFDLAEQDPYLIHN